MTDKLDEMIDAALNAEERELLHQLGDEPGYFTQAFGLFGGKLGWVTWLMMTAQILMFAAAVYLAVRFFQAEEPLEALKWGLPSAVLLIQALLIKLTLWPSLQANRVIREVKRLELQIARSNMG
ncbi:DUF6768 family protein [Qipengyuania sp. DSG2-2]|uniref:DUF6768 family protein n=1 Tax=Qipengyuania sp. DGS2-2 TaxID=3349631 RepID=UPI0036D254E6